MLFCGGHWPIRKLSRNDKGFPQEKNTFCLRTSEEESAIFTESAELESAFVEMFNIDNLWGEMYDNELLKWIDTIRSNGMSILEMSDIWENGISASEEWKKYL